MAKVTPLKMPPLAENSVIVVVDSSANVAPRTVSMCSRCGAVVHDKDMHNTWHLAVDLVMLKGLEKITEETETARRDGQ